MSEFRNMHIHRVLILLDKQHANQANEGLWLKVVCEAMSIISSGQRFHV